jgi:two-component system LytT family sensor kinase
MTDTLLIAQTLGFATGTALFVMLIALLRRAYQLSGRVSSGTGAAALGLLWNLGNLVKYLALLTGSSRLALPVRLADAFAYSATALLSTALLQLQSTRWTHPWQPRASRWMRVVSYLNAAFLILGFFATALFPSLPGSFMAFMTLSAYNLAFHLIAGLLVFRGAGSPARTGRVYSSLMLLAATGLALCLLWLIHFRPGFFSPSILSVIAQQASIPMALLSFAFLARFRFADIFVKRSLIMLAAVIVALGYGGLIVEPVTDRIRAASPYPEASAWIAATTLWCALLLAFPWLVRRLNRAADRWLFRRPDYRQLAQAFAEESEQAEEEAALFTLAEECARTGLAIAAARVLPRIEATTLGDEIADEIIHLRPGHPARHLLGEPEVEVIVPVQTQGQIAYLLAIAPGAGGRKLLSDELAFLSSLAERIGRKIEALRFESERRERQVREARLRHSLAEAELKALRAQINPHFLFNTLNTIADLIGSEPEKAEAMTERLAEVFRYVLARTERHLIPVSEEFEFLRTYLAIEEARFGDRLRVELTIDSSIAAEMIPSLILQPLVENAIKHGLSAKLGGGSLCVRAADAGEYLRLTVADDGLGWPGITDQKEWSVFSESAAPASSAPGGVGLRNVSQRLRTLYGERATMSIRSNAGQGVCVSLMVPKIPKDETPGVAHRRRSVGALPAAEAAERASRDRDHRRGC